MSTVAKERNAPRATLIESLHRLPRFFANESHPSAAAKLFLETTDCLRAFSPLQCLRYTSSATLNRANTEVLRRGATFNPLRDDYFVQEVPSIQLSLGHFNRSISLIHGNNLDEGTQLAAPFTSNLTSDAAFCSVVLATYGPRIIPILDDILSKWPNNPSKGQPNRPYYYGSSPNDTFYPNGPDGSINQYKRLSSFLQDAIFEAGRRQHLFAAGKRDVPAWSYRFAQPTPENATFAKYQDTAALGVQHASDLPYVFGFPPKAANISNQPKTLQPFITDLILNNITATMTAAWIHFANTGDPNGRDVPRWDQYSGNSSSTLNNSIGTELIFQPQGTEMQLDLYHWRETQWLLSRAHAFSL